MMSKHVGVITKGIKTLNEIDAYVRLLRTFACVICNAAHVIKNPGGVYNLEFTSAYMYRNSHNTTHTKIEY
jgi:hypothetical protein